MMTSTKYPAEPKIPFLETAGVDESITALPLKGGAGKKAMFHSPTQTHWD